MSKNHKLLYKTKIDTQLAFIVKVVSSGSSLLISALLARLFTVELVGAYFVFLQVVRTGAVLIRFGMDINAIRRVSVFLASSNTARAKSWVAKTLTVMACLYAVVSLLLWLFWPAIADGLNVHPIREFGYILILAVGVRAFEECLCTLLTGVNRIKLGVSLLDSPRQIMVMIVLFGVWMMGAELSFKTALIIYVLFTMPSIIIAIYNIYSSVFRRVLASGGVTASGVLKEGAPYFSMNVLSVLMVSMPLWIVSYVLGAKDAGIYGAMVQIALIVTFLLGVNNQVTPAAIAKLIDEKEGNEVEHYMRETARWSLYLAAPLAVLVILFGTNIISLVYDDAYSAGYTVLVLLTLAQFINAASGSPGRYLQMKGEQSGLLMITVFWMLLNALSAFLLSRALGLPGAALASCLTIIGQNLSMVVWVYVKYDIKTYATLRRQDVRIGTV